MLRSIERSGFVDNLSASLLEDQPDPDRLLEKISSGLNIDLSDSERVLYSIASNLNGKLFMPVSKAELILVEGCNLACEYCFESKVLNSKRPARRIMEPRIIKKAIDLVFEYSRESDRISFTLFGGEPTLNMPGIVVAVNYANSLAEKSGKLVEYHMTSNGVLFDEQMVDYFAANRIKVLLSVDGMQQAHDQYRVDKNGAGTFDRVIRGLKLLKKKQPWVGVKMTVMPSIAGTIYDGVRGLHALGVNQFLIGHATGMRWTEQALAIFRRQMEQIRSWYGENKGPALKISDFDDAQRRTGFFGCGAGRNTISVSCNGDITGCSRISTLDDMRTIGKLGNVNCGLYNIHTRMEMNTCDRLKGHCSDAGISDEYTGGCFATNYEETGDLFRPNMLQHRFSVLLSDITFPATIK